MNLPLSHLIKMIGKPAFVARAQGEIICINTPFSELLGIDPDAGWERSLTGLGIFSNHAELRGFIRGFKKAGPMQQLQLPGQRLKSQERFVRLTALWLEEDQQFIGVFNTEKQPYFSSSVPFMPDVSLLLNHLPYFVLTADGKGDIRYANSTAYERLSLDKKGDDLIGTLASVDAEFTSATWRGCLRTVRKEGHCSYTTTFLLRSGRLLPVLVTLTHVYGMPVQHVEIVARDISEELDKDRRLESARIKIEELEYRLSRKDQFLTQAEVIPSGNKVLVTESKAYRRILDKVMMVARTDSTVLITGESGTGKELLGRAIHANSRRAHKPMITINCGALPRDLIESELFGHRKGAFTGATRDHVGRFELADEGTLFLDEIGELPLQLQTRLLRFLQEGEFMPVGGKDTIYTDVRIISATNRDLDAMVKAGTFRQDLFYRLNVFPIHNIPLRERPEDIPVLINHFIGKYARQLNTEIKGAHPSLVEKLQKYSFPGNIRELENIVQRAMIMNKGEWLESPHIELFPIAASPLKKPDDNEWLSLEDMQREYIRQALAKTNGKVSGPGGAAELLQLKAQTLYTKIRKLGIQRR